MPKLDEYLKIGIDSFKVEGRNKSLYYVAIVTKSYRKAIDDWYKDPSNWNPNNYMQELQTLSNRGYTLAFHEGRLTNLAHNYDNTKSVSEWEFAGIIRSWEKDYFTVEVKNRIVSGDVLEFVPPAPLDSIFLRIYEFINAKNDKITEVINPGHKPMIKIPTKLFNQEDLKDLPNLLPVNTIFRKEKPISELEKSRIRLDKQSLKIEANPNASNSYNAKKTKFKELLNDNVQPVSTKTRRVGIEGCCAKGCNGCLMFWYDKQYSKAREALQMKKIGEML